MIGARALEPVSHAIVVGTVGGTHVTHIQRQFTKALSDHLARKHPDLSVTSTAIRNQMQLFVSSQVPPTAPHCAARAQFNCRQCECQALHVSYVNGNILCEISTSALEKTLAPSDPASVRLSRKGSPSFGSVGIVVWDFARVLALWLTHLNPSFLFVLSWTTTIFYHPHLWAMDYAKRSSV